MRNPLQLLFCFLAILLLHRPLLAVENANSGAEDFSENVAPILATHPGFTSQARVPVIKVLKILDSRTVYVKTNRYVLGVGADPLPGLRKGTVKMWPALRLVGDELEFKIGQFCMIGMVDDTQKLLLLKIEEGVAFFSYSGTQRNSRRFLKYIKVAPYEEGFGSPTPKIPVWSFTLNLMRKGISDWRRPRIQKGLMVPT